MLSKSIKYQTEDELKAFTKNNSISDSDKLLISVFSSKRSIEDMDIIRLN
jgi:hypothetical protein